MAPQVWVLWQSRWQSFPHDSVHVGTSWQVAWQASLQTVPQVSPMLWQSWAQPLPVQPRKQSLPPLQVHESPGSQPWVEWHPGAARATRALAAQATTKRCTPR
jgi:hypothetical protein